MGAEPSPQNAADEDLAYRRELRRRMLERRVALSAEQCTGYSAAVCRQLRGTFPQLSEQRVAFCWPVRNEPDLRPLLAEWLTGKASGFAALLPVVIGENQPLKFRAWLPESGLMPDHYGIPTPAGGEFLTPQALLLPVNAFDAACFRLGYGGGYFDRTLAALRTPGWRPLALGVGFELARVDSIRPQAHDLPLDAIITETGVHFPSF